jgi:hypothetical protein
MEWGIVCEIAESQWDWMFVIDGLADPTADEFAKAVRDSIVPVQARGVGE